jgi:hypothetical protein
MRETVNHESAISLKRDEAESAQPSDQLYRYSPGRFTPKALSYGQANSLGDSVSPKDVRPRKSWGFMRKRHRRFFSLAHSGQ